MRHLIVTTFKDLGSNQLYLGRTSFKKDFVFIVTSWRHSYIIFCNKSILVQSDINFPALNGRKNDECTVMSSNDPRNDRAMKHFSISDFDDRFDTWNSLRPAAHRAVWR